MPKTNSKNRKLTNQLFYSFNNRRYRGGIPRTTKGRASMEVNIKLSVGFSVSEWNASYVALVHEAGHNFGCQHDPANIRDPGSLIYPYARGYKFGVPLFGFTTIMGYNEILYPTYAPVL